MKIKRIASICSQSKKIVIYDKLMADGDIDMQWIGDGFAAYPAFDLPYIEPESISVIFDIPEKNRKKYTFRHEGLPEGINLEDAAPGESILDQSALEIVSSGHVLMPLYTSQGIVFIDTKYLAPLAGSEDTLELYERMTPGGHAYIAAKCGFMIMAVIMPYEVIKKDFVETIESIGQHCRVALENKESDHLEVVPEP